MMDTPTMRRSKDSHLRGERTLPSIKTLKIAVVRILSWYVTWNVAASRLLTATYCSEFCSVYSKAGMASFQLSPVRTEATRVRRSDGIDVVVGRVLDVSYRAYRMNQLPACVVDTWCLPWRS